MYENYVNTLFACELDCNSCESQRGGWSYKRARVVRRGAIDPKAAICSGRAMRRGLVHYIDFIFVIILMVTFYM